jgi:hypothetical protein
MCSFVHYKKTVDNCLPACSFSWRPPTTSETTAQTMSHGNDSGQAGADNLYSRKSAALRAAIMAAVTEQDIREVVAALVTRAKDGNVAAARILLSYTVGRPTEADRPEPAAVAQFLERLVPGQTASPPPPCPDTPATIQPTQRPGTRLNARERAALRRAERKRLKAERKQLLKDRLATARAAAPSGNGSTGHAAPSANGDFKLAP